MKACNDATTLYGRTLTVTAVSENGDVTSEPWREIEYDPETDRDRWQAMQAAWRFARGDDPEDDPDGWAGLSRDLSRTSLIPPG